jgi:hypothetical protein
MHDYEHPPEWPSMSDAERARWYTQERARRQAMRQSGTGERLSRGQDRHDRVADARSATVNLEDNR